MSALVPLVLGGLGCGLVLLWFWHLERRGQGMVVLATIVAVLVVEGSLYPGFDAPAGIFHPTIGSQSFRPYELLIVLALLARLLGRGLPTRIGTPMLWWVGFFAWICVQALIGVFVGHSPALVAFEAKAVIYLGALALGAGIPAGEFVHGRAIRRLIVLAAMTATLMIFLDFAGVRVTGRVLGVPLEDSGRLGSDAASIFLALGIIALGIALPRREGRTVLLLSACPLLLSTFVAYQRAVLISFVVLVILTAVAFLTASARARVRFSPVELFCGALVLVALVTGPWVVSGLKGRETPSYPVASRVTALLADRSKQLSAQDRLNQYREAGPLMLEKPFLGWGLAKTYAHFNPGREEFEQNNLTHNIAGDLVLRTGLVGLALFAVAMFVLLRDGWRVWRESADDALACLALACVVVLAGLIGKGMAESLFEKFRLAVLIGVLLGMLRSVVLSESVGSSGGQRDSGLVGVDRRLPA